MLPLLALAPLLLPVPFRAVSHQPAPLLPVQGIEVQEFDSAGVPIHFTLQGEGDVPLVLLHGFAGDGRTMQSLAATLAHDYWVITPDLRGHGKSGKPHEPEKYGREMMEDIVRLLDHLGVERAHVVGYSMGGLVTLALVTAHPERVISAVAGGYGWAEFAPEGTDVMDQVAAALEKGDGFGPLFGEPDKDDPDSARLAQIAKALLAANDPLALAAAARGFRRLALTEPALRANRVPTLALIGADDALKSDVDRLATAMAALEVVVIAGSDHLTTPTRKAFTENLLRFLGAHAPAAAASGR